MNHYKHNLIKASRATLLLFCLMAIRPSIHAQPTAVEYMDQLSTNYKQISRDTWDYIKQASRGKNARKIEKRRVELANSLKSARYDAGRVKSFEGDASLRDAVIEYLSVAYFSINSDYKKLVDMEAIAEESYDDMEAYLLTKERVQLKMDSASNTLRQAEQAFANQHSIRLVEGKETRVGRKLSNASEITAYYNKLYLLYFKSGFYERKMLEAMSANRVSDVEQFRQSLELTSREGMEAAKKMPAFRSDTELRDACYGVLEFYYGEAKRYMPAQIEFYVKEDKMKTLQKNIESKNKKSLTQEEIDEYNQAVNDFNASIAEFNKTNDYLNKYREIRFKKFSDATNRLYDKHM